MTESFIVSANIPRCNFSQDFAGLRLLMSFFAPKYGPEPYIYPLKMMINNNGLWIELRYLKNYLHNIKHVYIFNSKTKKNKKVK